VSRRHRTSEQSPRPGRKLTCFAAQQEMTNLMRTCGMCIRYATDAHVHQLPRRAHGTSSAHGTSHGGMAMLSTHVQPRPPLRNRLHGPTSPRGSPTRLILEAQCGGQQWCLAQPPGVSLAARGQKEQGRILTPCRGGTPRRHTLKTEVAWPEGTLRRREGRRAT